MEVGRDSLWIGCGNANGSIFVEADKSRDSLPQGEKGPSGKAGCC